MFMAKKIMLQQLESRLWEAADTSIRIRTITGRTARFVMNAMLASGGYR